MIAFFACQNIWDGEGKMSPAISNRQFHVRNPPRVGNSPRVGVLSKGCIFLMRGHTPVLMDDLYRSRGFFIHSDNVH
jgi:hypothetical protein